MKAALRAAALIALGFAAYPVVSQVVGQTQRFPQFENSEVKVWKTVIQPKQPLAMHHHDHGRVLIALTAGTLNIIEPSGKTETLPLAAGKAYWLPAMAPGTVHSDGNGGDKALEVMVVELQQDLYVAPK